MPVEEGQGFNPENINKTPEIGKASFEEFVRNAQRSNVPEAFNSWFRNETDILLTRKAKELNERVGDTKYYGRYLFNKTLGLLRPPGVNTNIDLAANVLGKDPIGDDGYIELADKLLELKDVPAPKARYAVDYAEAVAKAKTMELEREKDIEAWREAREKAESREGSYADIDIKWLARHSDQARAAYNAVTQQEKKATSTNFLSRIRGKDLTPQEIVETRDYVENHYATPQTPQEQEVS